MEKTLATIIRWSIYLVPFIVLIVSSWLFFPYITGKNYAFRALAEIMLAAYIPLALFYPQYRPRKSALFISLGVFVGIVFLADISGTNPFLSFWSKYERMDGFLTLAHMGVFALVAGSVLSVKNWLNFWRTSIAVSAFVCAGAFWQFVETGKVRLDVFLGNPIYLAVYVLFHIFIMSFLLAGGIRARFERYAYTGLIFVELIVLYMTATRGAMLGLIAGMIVAAVGIAFSRGAAPKLRRASVTLLVGIVALAGVFFVMKDSSFVQAHAPLKRLASLSLSDTTTHARFVIWGMAIDGFKEHPILGWGQGNFTDVFNKYYDPRLAGVEEWYDRAHNVILNWLVTAGLLGLLTYLSLFVVLLYSLYKINSMNPAEKWILVGLFAAYGVQNLTVFDTVVSYTLFFAVLAWVHTRYTDEHSDVSAQGAPANNYPWLVFTLSVLLAWVLIYALNVSSYKTNTESIQALTHAYKAAQAQNVGNQEALLQELTAAFDAYQAALARGNFGVLEVRERLAKTAMEVVTMDVSDDEKRKWLAAGAVALSQTIEAYPDDPRPIVQIALLYEAYGLRENANQAHIHAIALSPTKPVNYLRAGGNLVAMNQFEEALPYMQKAYELAPFYKEARVFYAATLLYLNRVDEATAIIDEEPAIQDDPRIMRILEGK